ncbi:MAG: hypothetical protein ACK5HT_05155, partial [Draconibacterium sp.]
TNRDEITVVSKKQIPLFVPVSQEEYIKAHISFWEKEIAKNRNRAHTGDKGIVELYRQQDIWQDIFGLIVE